MVVQKDFRKAVFSLGAWQAKVRIVIIVVVTEEEEEEEEEEA
jgi:hypothetical protein